MTQVDRGVSDTEASYVDVWAHTPEGRALSEVWRRHEDKVFRVYANPETTGQHLRFSEGRSAGRPC